MAVGNKIQMPHGVKRKRVLYHETAQKEVPLLLPGFVTWWCKALQYRIDEDMYSKQYLAHIAFFMYKALYRRYGPHTQKWSLQSSASL